MKYTIVAAYDSALTKVKVKLAHLI